MSKRVLIRIVLALAVLWIVLLCLIYISGEKYRDHAISILKTHLDEYLLTEIQIKKDNIHVSLLKKFPYAVIDLKDILIKSSPDFAQSDFHPAFGDTLLFAETISLMFNLKSLLSKTYILRKIEIEDGKLNILGDKQGKFNYSIIRQNRTRDLQDTITFDLKDISLKDILLQYNDKNSHVVLSAGIQKAHLSGSFNESEYYLRSQIEAENTFLEIAGKRILYDEDLFLATDIRKKESVFTFSGGRLVLFGIHANFKGIYNTLKGNYNFSADCASAPFQRLDNNLMNRYLGELSLKPAGGNMNIRFNISGRGSATPFMEIKFLIRDGVIKHKESRIKVEKLFVQGYYSNGKQRNIFSNHFQIDSLLLNSGKSKLYLSGSVDNFKSPMINATVRGNLELNKLSIFKAFSQKVETDGYMSTEMKITGTLPQVEQLRVKDIRNIKLQGFIMLYEAGFKPENKSLPAAVVSGKINLKNLSEIDLEDISVRTGSTDLLLNGNISNIPFFTTDHTQFPVYRCRVQSNEFHFEDIFIASDKVNDTINVIFPDSTIIYADITLKSFAFGRFQASDVSGNLFYQPKTFVIRNFAMQSQGGKIQSNLSLTQFGTTISTNFDAFFEQVDISDVFFAFKEFGQTVITHEYIAGTLTGHADGTAAWDIHLNPLYNKLFIRSNFVIENGELINYQPLLGLSDYIAVEELKHIKFDNLHANVLVADEKVTIDQTQLNSSAISLLASGEHDFENRYTYRFQVHLADVLWKKARKKRNHDSEFGYIINDDHERIILPLIITGKDTIFRVTYDKKAAGAIFRDKIIKEKQEWKELVTPDNSLKPDTQNFKIEWEENADDQEKTNNNDKDEGLKEFHIEWDDE